MSAQNTRAASLIAPAFATYYGLLGVLQPFLPPVLRQQGLSSQQAGLVLGGAALLSSIAPLTVARYVASWQTPAHLARFFGTAVALTAMALSVLIHVSLPAWVALVIIFAIFWSPLAALLDTLAVAATQTGWLQYGHLRMMGSFGFIAVASVMGIWTSDDMRDLLHHGLLVVGLALAVSAWLLPNVAPKAPRTDSIEHSAIKTPRYIKVLLASLVLHWASFGAYQYGFTMLAQESGLSSKIIGVAWSVGVVSEVACFVFAAAIIRRFGWWPVMAVAFFSAGTRWLILGCFPSAGMVLFSQLLHGPGFALFYASSMNAIDRAGPAELKVTLQSLFSGWVTGFGAFIGNVLAGWANSFMPIHSVFVYSLPLQLAAFALLWRAKEVRGENEVSLRASS